MHRLQDPIPTKPRQDHILGRHPPLPPAARQLVFPHRVGRIPPYGAFLELVWQPLLAAAKLPYRKPHAMRHSYATWMLEAGADLRWAKDQLGHASIDETEGTYGHLERERHERRVDLDAVLGIGSAASPGVHASGRRGRD
jgi:integrase